MQPINFVKRAKFQTFNDPVLERMLQAATEFTCAINVEKPCRWLTFTGTSGVGKTYLAKAILRVFRETIAFHPGFDAKEQRLTGQRAQFVDWRLLCASVMDGAWGWVDDLCEDDLVIIDDIGAEHADKRGLSISLIDRLLNARLRKWTAMTCNIPLADIADRLDARIASRMIRDGNQVVECDTIDYAMR